MVVLTDSMRLTDSNPDVLMTNPERELGRYITNPETTRVSDEEVQEADCASVVGSIPEKVVKYTKVLETGQQMVMLIVTLMGLAGHLKRNFVSQFESLEAAKASDEGYQ